jgi:hypothetical protein
MEVGGRVGREMKLKDNKTEEYDGAKMEREKQIVTHFT